MPRAHIAVYLFYLVIAVLITWPLVTVFSTHFPGFADGDAHEMTRHIWWFKYALQHGQPLIFQPMLGYPDGIQGVILWSDPLQFFPGWLFAFFLPLPAAYNLFVLLTLALNGWSAYWLVGKLLQGWLLPLRPTRFPPLLAGLIFMSAPVMQGHLASGHGGLLVQWPLPLLAYTLLKLCGFLDYSQHSALSTSNSRLITRYSVAAAFLIFLTALGHTLQLIYAVMPLAGILALTLLIRHDWKGLLRLSIVVAAGCALLVLFLLPVLSATFDTTAYTGEMGGVRYSADLLGIVTPSFEHILFGQLEYTHRVLGINIVEGSSYVGIVAGLLSIIAVWKMRPARWWLALAGTAWVLSLGPLLKIFDTPLQTTVDGHPTYITLPWALLYDLPGFSLARTPGRFDFLLALAVAVMAGYGASLVLSSQFSVLSGRWLGRYSRLSTQHLALSTLAFAFLAALVLFEYQSFWPLPTYSAEIPRAVYDLAQRNDVRALFDIPWDNMLAAKDALWLQTAHEKPMIGGQVTRSTPVSPAKLTILQQTLDLALLNEAGVDVIIVHKKYDKAMVETVRHHLGAPFYEGEQVALFNVPKSDTASQFTALIPPRDNPVQAVTGFLYVPTSGWVALGGIVKSGGQDIDLSLDHEIIDQWNGDRALNILLPIQEAGYHTLTIANHLSCPEHDPIVQECRDMTMGNPIPAAFLQATFAPVQWEQDLQLAGAILLPPSGNMLRLGLWWHFDQPITDQAVRFVKVLDEQGKQIAGDDHSLGSFTAGEQRVETLQLELPADLAPGTYKVFVGWYAYPDLNRFAVLSDVPGARDGLAQIGEFRR
jgi:hypothetical protein